MPRPACENLGRRAGIAPQPHRLGTAVDPYLRAADFALSGTPTSTDRVAGRETCGLEDDDTVRTRLAFQHRPIRLQRIGAGIVWPRPIREVVAEDRGRMDQQFEVVAGVLDGVTDTPNPGHQAAALILPGTERVKGVAFAFAVEERRGWIRVLVDAFPGARRGRSAAAEVGIPAKEADLVGG